MPTTETGSPQAGEESRSAPIEILVLAGIAVAIGVVTRFVTRSSLWLDESLTVNIARLPLGDLATALKHDGHPPLFYVLLHGWTSLFGTGDVAVRSLSGVFGIAALPLVWIIGRRRGGSLLAWVAVAVVALSPFAVRYSDEARMYSMVMFLVLAGWLLLDDILVRGRATILRFVGLVLVAAALLYTHYWSLWLLAAVGLVMIRQIWRSADAAARRPYLGVVLALVVAGITFVPWLPTMLYQSAHTGTPWASPMRPSSALSVTFADFAAGNYGEQSLIAGLLLVATLLGVFGFVIDRSTTGIDVRTRPQFRVETLIAAMTFVIGVGVSFILRGAYASRYASVIFPLVAMLAAAGLTRFGARWVRFGVITGMCVLLAFGALWNIRSTRTQMHELADKVAASSAAGDIVVFCPDQLGPSGSRVMPDNLTLVSYPDHGDARFVDWVDYKDRNQAADPVAFAARLLVEAGPTHTIYVVWNGAYKTFENQCEALLGSLGAARPAEILASDDSDHFFEHAGLYRFAAPA
jgi:mannosyltransferase